MNIWHFLIAILFLPIFFLIVLYMLVFLEVLLGLDRFDETYKRKLEKEWKFDSYKEGVK